ncbi:MAG TPA: right-handed parallel beta-helix repeat-containing protein, partial [Candidatus Tectomicrobia bacterium]
MAFRQRTIHSYSVILFMIILFLGFTRPDTARATGILLYVDWQATGANDGSSWSDAFINLQSALTAAGSGDEIWVASGTYQPGDQRTDSFRLKTGVAIYGGFAATETARDQRDWVEHLSVLSGDIDPSGDEDSYHVVTGSGANATAVLDGFTITGGRADADSPHDSGGGIYNDAGSPTLRNVIIKGNLASYGGGIYDLDSSPTLLNALVLDNSGADGGGMYNTNSSPWVINVTFSGNGVTKNGSAIANFSNSNPSITNSILWGNKSPSLHQMYDENSTPNISYTDIQGPPKPGPGNLNSN